MKTLILRLLISLFILIDVHALKVINVATGDFSPYTNATGRENGYVIHLVREAFRTQGYELKLHFMPWGRVFQDTAEGKFDFAAFFVCTPEREKVLICSKTHVSQDNFVFFHKKTNPIQKWEKLSDLKNLRIGITKGYFYEKDFEEISNNKNNVIIEPVKNDLQNFKKLLKDRIDVFPIDIIVGYSILRKHFSQAHAASIKVDEKTIFNQKAHILFPKNVERTKELMNAFEKGMRVIEGNGLKQKMDDDLLSGSYE